MKKIIEDIEICYTDEGNSEKIAVFLHGWGSKKETMYPISNIIKDKYRIVAIDLPGFGESTEPKTVFNSYDYVRVILKLLDELEIKQASFIGHSFGGKISSIISAEHKERVNDLILIDSAGLIPKRGLDYKLKVYSYKLGKFFNSILPGDKEARLENYKKKHGSDDYQNSSGIMRDIMVTVVNENIRPILSKIEAETLLIWGDNDDATPLYMGEIFEKEIPNSGLVILENSGHFSYIDNYAVFKAVIESFMLR